MLGQKSTVEVYADGEKRAQIEKGRSRAERAAYAEQDLFVARTDVHQLSDKGGKRHAVSLLGACNVQRGKAALEWHANFIRSVYSVVPA